MARQMLPVVILVILVAMETLAVRLSDPLGILGEAPGFHGDNVDTGRNYAQGQVLPKPQKESRGDLLTLSPSHFEFVSTGKSSDILSAALKRYFSLTFPNMHVMPDGKLPAVTTLAVNVKEDIKPMTFVMDESYTLEIASPTSKLVANTAYGALRGLETFSQVVHQNITGTYFVHENNITDFPRFHHRGFMIDTSRHYVANPIIYQFLDAMAYSKFNVFHWHIVDDPSFPYVSELFPSLHGQGAYNNVTHVYTRKDVHDIVEYARLRGIRVLPEFDTPGHTQSWRSIPNLLTKCYSGDKPNGGLGPIDPTIDANYVFLKSFFAEVGDYFPDAYVHMGGDEVSFSCWKSNPNIAKWMKAKGMGTDYDKLEQYYEQKLLDIMKSLGKQYVIWQEVVDNNVKVQSDTVVNIWRGGWQNEMAKITKLGYRAILSSCWYLNYISYGEDWGKYYKCDPQDFTGTDAQKELVIGGTACMWGEMVDGTNLISRTWARGCSVGERLWSDASVKDMGDAYNRMWEQRCRYIRRGLQAENIRQSQFCYHEWRNTHHEEL